MPGEWRGVLSGLLAHAWPILIAQLASIGMMVVDTAVLGHVSATDLAAVAIGSGIHVSVVFGLVGVLQAVAPVAAHAYGAARMDALGEILQHGFWLALLLSLPGIGFLCHPDWLLQMAGMDTVVEQLVLGYLSTLSWGLLPVLLYRTFYAFCNALGRPGVLMRLGLASLLAHAGLSWLLAIYGGLGVRGCALSNVLIAWAMCAFALVYLLRGDFARRFKPLRRAFPLSRDLSHELLRLGLPMGMSNFIEISAFTLVALFVSPLGASVVAGHRVIANLSALSYMLPLSMGIATMVALGKALGARDLKLAAVTLRLSLWVSAGMSAVLGLAIWLGADWLIAAYTDDPVVRDVARGLVLYIAIYQFIDALQTIAAHALRAYRVSFWPMLVQGVAFWGVGLAGGTWFCYFGQAPMGVAGFWLASVLSLVLLAGCLLPMLGRVERLRTLMP